MILITIMKPGDIRLALALCEALGEKVDVFLLFSNNGLLTAAGELPYKHGCDFEICMLNPQNFDLVVSFSGPCDPRLLHNVVLLQCFKEMGIPSVEIQHGLFQYGINNEDVALRVGSNVALGDQLAIDTAYAATEVIPWAGDDGIGYLKSELEAPTASREPGSFVLITTNNNWHVMTDVDRYKLGIAICRLIDRQPDVQFVWKPHPAEPLLKFAKQLLDMSAEYKFPNLEFDYATPAEDLIRSCRVAISSVSTTLLDYQLCQKPTLVFAFAAVDHLLPQVRAKTFRNANELLEQWALCQESPEQFYVDTGVGPLNKERLLERLRSARARANLSPDWLRIALQYVMMRRAITAPPPKAPEPTIPPAVGRDMVARLERIEKKLRILDRKVPTPPADQKPASVLAKWFGGTARKS